MSGRETGQQPDEVSFGPRRPARGPRRRRQLIATGAALAAVAAVLAVSHRQQPPRRARPQVAVSEAGHPLLGVRGGWELLGYGPGQLIRIQLAAGRITRTAVPEAGSTGPVSFLAGPGVAIIRPLDAVPGYLVPDGRPARRLRGALSHDGIVIQGPLPGQFWLEPGFGAPRLELVRADGSRTGVSMRLPPAGPWFPVSDGRGYALVTGGSSHLYDLVPGGRRRLAGTLLAVGPTRWLTARCHGHRGCAGIVTDPVTGARRVLPGLSVRLAGTPGVIAPDGSQAAVLAARRHRVTLRLISLASGASRQVAVPLGQNAGWQRLAWAPDSQWLFVAAANGMLTAVNARTGRPEGLGTRLPSVRQLVIRG